MECSRLDLLVRPGIPGLLRFERRGGGGRGHKDPQRFAPGIKPRPDQLSFSSTSIQLQGTGRPPLRLKIRYAHADAGANGLGATAARRVRFTALGPNIPLSLL